METLERVEAIHSILKRMEDIDSVLDKITVIEEFINRFGTLEALIARFEEVERQLYILKEVFNVEEAAKYLPTRFRSPSRTANTSSSRGKRWTTGNAGIRYCQTGRLNGRRLLPE